VNTHALVPGMLKLLESPHIHEAFELGRIRTALTIALLITFVIALIALAANGTSGLDTGLGKHQITGALQAPHVTDAPSGKGGGGRERRRPGQREAALGHSRPAIGQAGRPAKAERKRPPGSPPRCPLACSGGAFPQWGAAVGSNYAKAYRTLPEA